MGRRIRGSATDGNTNASIAILGVRAGDQVCCRRRYCELLTGLANGPTYYFGSTGSAPGWGADGLSLRGSTPGVVRPPPWQGACLLLAQFITPSTRTPSVFFSLVLAISISRKNSEKRQDVDSLIASIKHKHGPSANRHGAKRLEIHGMLPRPRRLY